MMPEIKNKIEYPEQVLMPFSMDDVAALNERLEAINLRVLFTRFTSSSEARHLLEKPILQDWNEFGTLPILQIKAVVKEREMIRTEK